jgi:transcriptional regulator with XRE-family HTH domain
MHIGDSVKVALAKSDKTQVWLADKMGCGQDYISRVANNKANIRLRTVYKIARAFDMEIGEFIALADELKQSGL